MNDEAKNREIMVGRVTVFLAQPEIVLPAGALALVTELGTIKISLETQGSGQIAAGGESSAGVASRLLTVNELRQDVRTVADQANRMDPVLFPGVAAKFRVPVSKSYTELRNAARAILDEMDPPIREAFVARLGQPLFDRMAVLLTQFEAASTRKESGRQDRMTATSALTIAAARGLAIVRELDPAVRSALRTRPDLLSTWKSVSRVERRRASQEDEQQPPLVPATTPVVES